MTTIHIAASREYDVVIEPGLLTRLGTMAAELGLGRRAAVISVSYTHPEPTRH